MDVVHGSPQPRVIIACVLLRSEPKSNLFEEVKAEEIDEFSGNKESYPDWAS
jgi:hypothetical protein